jgi:hypothetical protein
LTKGDDGFFSEVNHRIFTQRHGTSVRLKGRTDTVVREHWRRPGFLEKKEIDDLYDSGTDLNTLRDCGETHYTCNDGAVKHMTG